MALRLPSWWKVAAFTANLLCGLVLSQVLGAVLEASAYKAVAEVVHIFTMWALSFIMVNVGYEFTVDKKDLAQYIWDYLIAMTAAGFPWLFVALWYLLLIEGMKADEAFLMARFAAPTSAGILFSMLEGAGLRDTWLFGKARILAIFDDLDTILLMIPLKVVMVGFKWELLVVIGIMVVLLAFAWIYLHRLPLPHSSPWSILYGGIVTGLCYGLYKVTKYHLPMEGIHIEVLLPAFVLGCMIDTPCARHELGLQKKASLVRKATRRLHDLGLGHTLVEPIGGEQWEGPKASAEQEDPGASAEQAGNLDVVRVVHPQEEVAEVAPPGWVVDEAELKREVKAKQGEATPEEPPGRAVDEAELNQEAKAKQGEPIAEDTDALHPSEGEAPEDMQDVRVRMGSKASKASNASRVSTLSRHGHDKVEIGGHGESAWEQNVQTTISMVFMVLVGLSMPPLVGKNAKGDSTMGAGLIVAHIVAVSVLMVLGKMFPVVCYRDEAGLRERLALCLGMCPRGEVGASIIVISLELGVKGPAVIISMCALVINLVLSGGFIGSVKLLLKTVPKKTQPTLEDLEKIIDKHSSQASGA